MSILSNFIAVSLNFLYNLSNIKSKLVVILHNLQIENDFGNIENYLAMFE